MGGVNLDEGVLHSCEKYDTEKDIWYEISEMGYVRKNSSVCALTSDSLYVFGGSSFDGRMLDSIE